MDTACPLSGFDEDAITWSIPSQLSEACGTLEGAVDAARVWVRLEPGGQAGYTSQAGYISDSRFACLLEFRNGTYVMFVLFALQATILCITTLLRFDECWLASGGDEADETIVDKAFSWLNSQIAIEPAMLGVEVRNCFDDARNLVVQSWERVQVRVSLELLQEDLWLESTVVQLCPSVVLPYSPSHGADDCDQQRPRREDALR